jgi:hypothetical protein
MTDLRKAAEQALEALENVYGKGKRCEAAIKELRQALAQPEQEPLGGEWVPCVKLPVIVHVRNQRDDENHISTREGITPVLPEDLIMRGVAGEEYPIGRELFERTYTFDTAPPKREWVGYTNEDRERIVPMLVQSLINHDEKTMAGLLNAILIDIEQQLKEKNT